MALSLESSVVLINLQALRRTTTQVPLGCLGSFQPFDTTFSPAIKLPVRRLTLFVLKSKVNDLSKDEWQKRIAGIAEDVDKRIGV